MEQIDASTQLEAAFEACLRAGELAVKRYLHVEDLPVPESRLNACVIEAGDEEVAKASNEGPGERLDLRRVAVNVYLLLDEAAEDFRPASRALADQARAILCDPTKFDIPIVDIELLAVRPQRFRSPSETGSQGGFLLPFVVSFYSREATPWLLEPTH